MSPLIFLLLFAGALITAAIIKHVAASRPLSPFDEAVENRDRRSASVAALGAMAGSTAADARV